MEQVFWGVWQIKMESYAFRMVCWSLERSVQGLSLRLRSDSGILEVSFLTSPRVYEHLGGTAEPHRPCRSTTKATSKPRRFDWSTLSGELDWIWPWRLFLEGSARLDICISFCCPCLLAGSFCLLLCSTHVYEFCLKLEKCEDRTAGWIFTKYLLFKVYWELAGIRLMAMFSLSLSPSSGTWFPHYPAAAMLTWSLTDILLWPILYETISEQWKGSKS